ncbi:hypothetical protein CGLAU_01680 [Corynebacterium glaucum]|uniref:Uncharacterized protein n=1 Tax=Corynebacterium glaucum TaxID=187491 RepID=A0A1Q2HU10_9CORY|nr:hypothetical protein CGLAU_01680 [Corynebacterium glaucum]WJZ06854.1 hypothetical protein CGLAUT_01740 [Corynebacterium glaucum]
MVRKSTSSPANGGRTTRQHLKVLPDELYYSPVWDLMRLLAVYLRDESPQKLDRFIATSHRVGPPPLL